MVDSRVCGGCGRIIASAVLPPMTEPAWWCGSCRHIIGTISTEARKLRRQYPAVNGHKYLSMAVAAILLGQYNTRPFTKHPDYAIIESTIHSRMLPHTNAALPRINIEELKKGLGQTLGGRSLAARLLSGLRAPAPPPVVELPIDAADDGVPGDVATHKMRIVKYEQQGVSPYYQSYCTECDVYSSKYWDPSDCPTSHPEMVYA